MSNHERRCPQALCGIALLALTGCGSSHRGDVVCTTEARAGIVVYLTDAQTSAPVSGATLELSAASGYQETMIEVEAGQYRGAVERAGTYDLHIARAGFTSQTRPQIQVTADSCHVRTVELPIALTRAAAPSIVIVFDEAGGVSVHEFR